MSSYVYLQIFIEYVHVLIIVSILHCGSHGGEEKFIQSFYMKVLSKETSWNNIA